MTLNSFVGIIDYGVGNIFSIKRSLDYLGVSSELTGDIDTLSRYDKIILPGVGAFGDAKAKLDVNGMGDAIINEASKGKLLIGICLGMQLLLGESAEYGNHKGLGLIPGKAEDMDLLVSDKSLPIPQMGWNNLMIDRDKDTNGLMRYVRDGDYVYFVHSYACIDCEESVIATVDYSFPVTAAVSKDNVMGVQFHPEKSGETGLSILKAFCEM